MAKNNDSIGRTLLVVIVLCLVCSVVVAGSAVGLKAKQEEQKLLDKQFKILEVTGLTKPNMSAEETQALYSKYIEPRLVDLKTGDFGQGNVAKFDMAAAVKDPAKSIALTPKQDKAGIRRVSNQAEVYLVKDDNNNISQVVLPVYGKGLWSVMYAFIAVDTDGNTVKGLTYYAHGETPGLGGEIENPNWLKTWTGKKLFNEQGQPAIHVVKGTANPNDASGIDGLSGATLTANGVQHTFEFWLSDSGYGPFLKKVHEGALNNG